MSSGMRCSNAGLLLLAVLPWITPTLSLAENADFSGNVALVRVLNKVVARSEILRIHKGVPLAFGTLLLTLHDCTKSATEYPPEAAARIEISEKRPADDHLEALPSGARVMTGNRLFSGWIFASSPALSMLEHPVYTLTLLDCLPESL